MHWFFKNSLLYALHSLKKNYMYMHGYEKHGAKIVLFLTPQAARGLGSRWGGDKYKKYYSILIIVLFTFFLFWVNILFKIKIICSPLYQNYEISYPYVKAFKGSGSRTELHVYRWGGKWLYILSSKIILFSLVQCDEILFYEITSKIMEFNDPWTSYWGFG